MYKSLFIGSLHLHLSRVHSNHILIIALVVLVPKLHVLNTQLLPLEVDHAHSL